MPVVDMPIEELRSYNGANPRPNDFEEYWDRALKEMNAVEPNISITKSTEFSAPHVKCMDLYFDGTRNGRVYAKLLIPNNLTGKAPAVLHFHGYSGNTGDWTALLNIASAGFIVAAMDCRGQGGKSSDKNPVEGNTLHGHIIRGLDDPDPDNLYYRQVFLDTALLAKIIMGMDEVDENRIAVFGGSQGGALTVACAALVPEIKLAAPSYPFLTDYKRVWDMDLDKGAYGELREYFRRFDPRHEKENEVFTKLGYIDLQYLANRIKAKIMFGTGLMDETCPPSTQFAIYNKITSEKSMVVYPDFGHEWLPGFADKTFEMFSELL